jgi:hypothetical protein
MMQRSLLFLLLPTTAQRLIELDDRKQLISSRPSQIQLGIEELAIRVERVEQRVHPTSSLRFVSQQEIFMSSWP